MTLEEAQKAHTSCRVCGDANIDATETAVFDRTIKEGPEPDRFTAVSPKTIHIKCNNCKTVLYEGVAP